jgi:hypothetical protein
MCTNGACVAEPLLAQDVSPVPGIATDGIDLFFGTTDGIGSCKVSGCAGVPTVVGRVPGANTQSLTLGAPLYFGVQNFLTDAGVHESAMFTLPKTGVNATPVLSGVASGVPSAMVVCGSNLCWIDEPTTGGPSVRTCPLADCSNPATLFTMPPGSFPGVLATDGQNVFASYGENAVVSCAITGCAMPKTLVTAFHVRGLAYFQGRLFFSAHDTGNDGSVGWCDPNACVPKIVASGLSQPYAVAADATGVYWTNDGNPGSVTMCPSTACGTTPVVVAGNQAAPTYIALDDQRLYWMNSSMAGSGSAQIMWVAK